MEAILENPDLGPRLDGSLAGWRVRHGGQGRVPSIVYRPDGENLLVALVAFLGAGLAQAQC
ncbi:MAG: hypothetical protein KDI01_00160, partial [Halioglobus sp.]|nr:hypothetical protein [Halioglobus sp.]